MLSLNIACQKICEESGLSYEYFYSRLVQLKPKTFGDVKRLVTDIYARNLAADQEFIYASRPCLDTMFSIQESAERLGIDWIKDTVRERIKATLKTQNSIEI